MRASAGQELRAGIRHDWVASPYFLIQLNASYPTNFVIRPVVLVASNEPGPLAKRRAHARKALSLLRDP